MLVFPLRLRIVSSPPATAAAWVIPGSDPAAWLDEIARWGLPMSRLALYPLPSPHGVLVPVPDGRAPVETLRAQPYACVAGALYVPAEARLDPPLSPAEAEAATDGRLLVLHPAAGLVAFAPGDAIRPSALLAPPAPTACAWDRADPGIATAPRLLSIEPETVPTVEMVMREGRGDIGTSPAEEIPSSPDEPKKSKAGGWLRRQLDKAKGLLSGKRGAAENAAPSPADLDEKRAREIQRLMRLLSSNPDEGLRFALPLCDLGTRGTARPSAALPPREVNFNLGRLGGGRAGDAWSLNADVVGALRAKYRDLANREIRQGRYRRAAYIFAELLGDHASAAATLAQGKHYREAAVLYKNHLKQPLAAARCLEDGGLFAEAIAIYEAEGQFLTAGDLYARIERPEEAEQMYRRAVEKLRQEGNLLSAAQILETKVGANLAKPACWDEALAMLASAWPWTEQAVQCLAARFDLLGRIGRHEEASRLVASLRQTSAPTVRSSDLVRGLVEVASRYPDRTVRDRAAGAGATGGALRRRIASSRATRSGTTPGGASSSRRGACRGRGRRRPRRWAASSSRAT